MPIVTRHTVLAGAAALAAPAVTRAAAQTTLRFLPQQDRSEPSFNPPPTGTIGSPA